MTKTGNPKKKDSSSKKDPPKKRKTSPSSDPPAASVSPAHTTNLTLNTRVIQMVRTPHTIVNHSYVDYSLVPPGPEDNNKPKQIQDMDFHQKLYSMLSREDLTHAIRWLPHGRAFRIEVPSRFEKVVCPEYFGHKRYSSFLYQLGLHGYKTISSGKDRGAFYSPLLLRGLPHVRPKFLSSVQSLFCVSHLDYHFRPANKVYAKPERVSASGSRP
eukprot:scaffold1803_cov92-Amphora_coffeaeformis.AAC.76